MDRPVFRNKKDLSSSPILRICYSTSCRKDFGFVWSSS